MKIILYFKETLKGYLLGLVIACALVQQTSYAQYAVVLSSSAESSVFELPLNADILQNLAADTRVQLATQAQHASAGINYPAWLSDATFSVVSQQRQRLAITVSAKRGNPEIATELLLMLNNAGRRSFKPMHLLFDSTSSYAGSPLPRITTTAASSIAVTAVPPLIYFEPELTPKPAPTVAIATPVPDQTILLQSFSVQAMPSPEKSARLASRVPKNNIPNPKSALAMPALAANAALPTPDFTPNSTASAPSLPSTDPPVASTSLTQPVIPMPIPNAGSTTALEQLLTDWSPLAGVLAMVLALLYLFTRAVSLWRQRRAEQMQTSFIDLANTIPPLEQSGTNTVFGISTMEANAMHAKWLREQTASRK